MRYCITHDLMADYFKENESEVLDMVSTKWDWNEALRVAREDAAEMAREEGMEKGITQRNFEIARKMLAKGMNEATVLEITGLSAEEIQLLKAEM